MRAVMIVLALVSVADSAAAFNGNRRTSKIEAVKGKAYRLTKAHGPWMIMVASMRDVPKEKRRSTGGFSAQQAADEMVLALRRAGVPAYTFSQKEARETIKTQNRRTGESEDRSVIAQQDRVVVVAGNYDSAKNKTAQATLAWIKGRFQQKLDLLSNPQFGAIYKRTPGRPGPLSRAFLMPNPLLSPDEIKGRRTDPLLITLNKDMQYSLLKCPGKYSVAVATFYGQNAMHLNNTKLKQLSQKLDKNFGMTLDQAAMKAWRLTEALRQAKSLGYDQNYEAYIYHDRHKSVVTIGSFNSRNDPAAIALAKTFAAKKRMHPKTGKSVLAGEIFSLPRYPGKGKLPEQTWIFDPVPSLMKVPRIR